VPAEADPASYSLYLVRCGDGTIYTGISTDVDRRLREHERDRKGARYLKGRGPLTLVYRQTIGNRSTASRVEHRVKRLSSADKQDIPFLKRCIAEIVASLD